MASLRIELLGGVAFRLASGANLTLPTRKSRLLLAYLALAQGRAQPRAKLMNLLWGDRSEPQARGSLRQELHALRQSLPGRSPAPPSIAGDSVALDPRAATVDAVVFESWPAAARRRLSSAPPRSTAGTCSRACRPGPAFEEWLSIERQRLRDVAVAALGKLLALEMSEARSRWPRRRDGGSGLGPGPEETHRALMRLLARQGQRNAALRQYQLCRAALMRELGVEPEEATERLHRDLLRRSPREKIKEDPVPRPTPPQRLEQRSQLSLHAREDKTAAASRRQQEFKNLSSLPLTTSTTAQAKQQAASPSYS